MPQSYWKYLRGMRQKLLDKKQPPSLLDHQGPTIRRFQEQKVKKKRKHKEKENPSADVHG
jgi:hypothetical protein